MRTPRLLTLTLGALSLVAPVSAQDGAILGRVLVDSTGLSLPAAQVALAGGGAGASDADGRYILFGPSGPQIVLVQAQGFTAVSRRVVVSGDAAVLALDARLTALAEPVAIDGAGGELRAASLVITVPADAVSASTEFRLTALSGQGLPARLPLGWAPARAFDLRSAGDFSGTLSASATDLPAGTLHLVRYRPEGHDWVMVVSGLTPADGQLTVEIGDPGAYALVAADAAPAPPIPGPGAVLTGVAAVVPAGGLLGSVRVEPPLASSMGGVGRAFIHLESPLALPSGTVFQVRLLDDYLVDGEPVFEEPRHQDVALYRPPPGTGSVLEAVVPGARRAVVRRGAARQRLGPRGAVDALRRGRRHHGRRAGRDGGGGRVPPRRGGRIAAHQHAPAAAARPRSRRSFRWGQTPRRWARWWWTSRARRSGLPRSCRWPRRG